MGIINSKSTKRQTPTASSFRSDILVMTVILVTVLVIVIKVSKTVLFSLQITLSVFLLSVQYNEYKKLSYSLETRSQQRISLQTKK